MDQNKVGVQVWEVLVVQDYDLMADQIATFLRSDIWKVIKSRLLYSYGDKLQVDINRNVKLGDLHEAGVQWGIMEGIKNAVDITERIPSEIIKKQLVVDVALSVIENKQREVRK